MKVYVKKETFFTMPPIDRTGLNYFVEFDELYAILNVENNIELNSVIKHFMLYYGEKIEAIELESDLHITSDPSNIGYIDFEPGMVVKFCLLQNKLGPLEKLKFHFETSHYIGLIQNDMVEFYCGKIRIFAKLSDVIVEHVYSDDILFNKVYHSNYYIINAICDNINKDEYYAINSFDELLHIKSLDDMYTCRIPSIITEDIETKEENKLPAMIAFERDFKMVLVQYPKEE